MSETLSPIQPEPEMSPYVNRTETAETPVDDRFHTKEQTDMIRTIDSNPMCSQVLIMNALMWNLPTQLM